MIRVTSLIFMIAILAVVTSARDDSQRYNGRKVISPYDRDKMSTKEQNTYDQMKLRMETLKSSWEMTKAPEQKENISQYNEKIQKLRERQQKAQQEQMREKLNQCLQDKKLTESQKAKIEKAHKSMRQRREQRMEKIKAIWNEKNANQKDPSQ